MFMNKARAYVAPEVEILDVAVEAGFAVSNETGAQTEDFGYDNSQENGSWELIQIVKL